MFSIVGCPYRRQTNHLFPSVLPVTRRNPRKWRPNFLRRPLSWKVDDHSLRKRTAVEHPSSMPPTSSFDIADSPA